MRDGTNLYAYAANDPVGYVDPFGFTRQDPQPTGVAPTDPGTTTEQLGLPRNRAELIQQLSDAQLVEGVRAAAKPGLTIQFTNAAEATEFLFKLSPGFTPPNDPGNGFRGIVLGANLDFGSPRGFLVYRGSGGGTRLESRAGYFLEQITPEAGFEAPLFAPIDLVAGLAAPLPTRSARSQCGWATRSACRGSHKAPGEPSATTGSC